MPSTRDIRRRIKSVRNTAQITKAMQMIAAAKMRKAQQRALDARPYARMLNRVLVSLSKHSEDELHPLLQARPVHHTLVYVVATDKGLCGGLNTNLFREIQRFDSATTSAWCARRGKASIGRSLIWRATLRSTLEPPIHWSTFAARGLSSTSRL